MLKTKERLVPITAWRTSDAQRLTEQPLGRLPIESSRGEVQGGCQRSKRSGTPSQSNRSAGRSPIKRRFLHRVNRLTKVSATSRRSRTGHWKLIVNVRVYLQTHPSTSTTAAMPGLALSIGGTSARAASLSKRRQRPENSGSSHHFAKTQ